MDSITNFHNDYNLLTGLRGPDTETKDKTSIVLKGYVTERLRGIVFAKGQCRGNITYRRLTAENINGLRQKLKQARKNHDISTSAGSHHFISHLIRAIRATEYHRIWGGLAEELIDILYRILDRTL